MTCSICHHEHVSMINLLLLESPHPVRRVAMFYDLDILALEHHKENYLKSRMTFYPINSSN